ncbi:hypothetical protein Tco_1258177 [Tanacetum coccineum]
MSLKSSSSNALEKEDSLDILVEIQNVVNEDLPQLLDLRGGSHVIDVLAFDVEDFSSWKDRFLVYLDGLEPIFLKYWKMDLLCPSHHCPLLQTSCINHKSNGHMKIDDDIK